MSCRSRTIFWVSVCFSSIANKSKHPDWAFRHEGRRDVAKCTELLFKVGLCPLIRNVLDENIVENLAEVSLVPGRELDSDSFFSSLGLKQSFGGVFRLFKADKAIASRRVVFVQRDFAGYYVTIDLENIFEFLRVHMLWNFSDEQVLVHETVNVRAEQVVLVRQSAARLTLQSEVA